VKAATGFAGGIGRNGSVCGGYTGGVMALGMLYGRDVETMKYADPEERMNRSHQIEGQLTDLVKLLTDKFNAEYGSMICNDIEKKLFGRSFDKWNPEDRKEKDRLGGYKEKCPSVVGNSVRWVAELIMEKQGKRRP
jgi:C_GCAxxG_C_C family probable redox protein